MNVPIVATRIAAQEHLELPEMLTTEIQDPGSSIQDRRAGASPLYPEP